MNEAKQADEVRTVEGLSDKERDAFEAWWRTECTFPLARSKVDAYEHPAPYWGWRAWQHLRAASLATQAQQGEPQGWKLVPITPTSEMLAALTGEWHNSRYDAFRIRYGAMLSASPIAPAAQAVRMLTEDERDARRYRWWREWAMGDEGGALLYEFERCDTPEDVDAFIDKVLSALPLEQQEGWK